jgi:hypothetical protein
MFLREDKMERMNEKALRSKKTRFEVGNIYRVIDTMKSLHKFTDIIATIINIDEENEFVTFLVGERMQFETHFSRLDNYDEADLYRNGCYHYIIYSYNTV